MINVNELRIGNLVTIDNKEFYPIMKDVPLQISQILERESLKKGIWTHAVSLEYPNKLKNVYYQNFGQFLEFIKPIELTEEWLLKCRFVESYRSDFRVKYEHKKCNEIGFDFSCRSIIESGFRYFGKHIKIDYVHQLQNLYFALTNEELKINII